MENNNTIDFEQFQTEKISEQMEKVYNTIIENSRKSERLLSVDALEKKTREILPTVSEDERDNKFNSMMIRGFISHLYHNGYWNEAVELYNRMEREVFISAPIVKNESKFDDEVYNLASKESLKDSIDSFAKVAKKVESNNVGFAKMNFKQKVNVLESILKYTFYNDDLEIIDEIYIGEDGVSMKIKTESPIIFYVKDAIANLFYYADNVSIEQNGKLFVFWMDEEE